MRSWLDLQAPLLVTPIFPQPSLDTSWSEGNILKVSEESDLLQPICWVVAAPPRVTGHLVQSQHNDFMSQGFFYPYRVPWGHWLWRCLWGLNKNMEWVSCLWAGQKWKHMNPWVMPGGAMLFAPGGLPEAERETTQASVRPCLLCCWRNPCFFALSIRCI